MSLRAFQSTRLLAALNVIAVGASFAAATTAIFGTIGGAPAGLSTLVIGWAWAALLRSPKMVRVWPRRASGLRIGWIASLLVAIVSVRVWVLMLVCFGLPIAWSQRLALRGLAGRERGESIVGGICVALGLGALAVSVGVGADAFDVAPAILGIFAGAVVTVLSMVREALRRAFVRRVAAGEVPDFCVQPTAEGAALVRIAESGRGYRVANIEELTVLDEAGQVVGTYDADLRSSRAQKNLPQ